MHSGGVSTKFGLVGAFVGKYPASCITLSLFLLAVSSSGLYFRISFKVGLNDGFVTPDAPSRREIATQKSFFGGEGESWYLALFALTKRPNGNMLNSAEFNELNDFYTTVTEKINLTLEYREVSQVFSYDLNIAKHIFNRTYSNKTGELIGSKFMAYYFTVFVSSDLRKKQVELFEKEVGSARAQPKSQRPSRASQPRL
uniref:Uncharacterized protein n=1 Tax=Ditylenchus dipsaci TaxID=166011 RepID=A0A915DBU9_9BILA